MNRPEDGKQLPAAPSGYRMAGSAIRTIAPLALLGWVAGAALLRTGLVRRWPLATAAATVATPGPLLIIRPTRAAGGLQETVATLGAALPAALTASAVLEALGVVLVRGGPDGRGDGAGGDPGRHHPTPPARHPCPRVAGQGTTHPAAGRGRARRQATERADREGRDLRSNVLAVSLGGMVASWRIGSSWCPGRPARTGLADEGRG